MFAAFANGTYYGSFDAANEAQAFEMIRAEIGGDIDDDFRYFPVTAEQAATVDAWWSAGADAADIPACVAH